MDRRRGSVRPASSEEVQCWTQASNSLSSLSNIYTASNSVSLETIARANKLLTSWPPEDSSPGEGYESTKANYKRLSSALKEIKENSEKEEKIIKEAIEQISVLIALRKASEDFPEKRNKRPRPSSPPARGGTPQPGNGRASLHSNSTRGSVGPTPAIPFSREPKARREALAKQLPLQEGRKVAFHPPSGKTADGTNTDGDENTWILAVITKCINQDKNRYEVQDVEPQEDGQPGLRYNTTLRAIIPLPDPNVQSNNAAHLNAYPEFSAGSTVMALYPDTSCFYRAEVIASPKDLVPGGRATSSKHIPTYKLKFEDDDDQEHSVQAQWVVEWPGI
ncbi:hypothetical protein CONPUDRAFT_137092 [Coniophora puteana RWD-64-598 SS2]|uniref:SGF29 C-terminal domain-containing protein n=1 Tax=Coniophora puteana (strain RWD-64-598) TaxID=741705 RepID=A0A5M3MPJ5_CONPW|nr:uncharacterized protein CONPUDRAFT_137092 [Coniophora puteana RWD-64-598 SS2]EIW80967.1 hypothetical protein CONPUDRAFT_137092 [Coniophora puteana RWD-64-598 SS2]